MLSVSSSSSSSFAGVIGSRFKQQILTHNTLFAASIAPFHFRRSFAAESTTTSTPTPPPAPTKYSGPFILKRGDKNTVDGVLEERNPRTPLIQTMSIRSKHTFLIDDRGLHGGSDAAPGPYDLLIAALVGCKSMTLRIWTSQKGKILPNLRFEIMHSKKSSNEIVEATERGLIDLFEVQISAVVPSGGDARSQEEYAALTPEYKKELMEISSKCPVHKTLAGNPRTIIRSKWVD